MTPAITPARRLYRRVLICLILPLALVIQAVWQTWRCIQLHNLWNFIGAGWRMNIRSAAKEWRA